MDHTDIGLRAVVKSLNDVIAPSIDSSDPLAAEQLKLVVHYLEFLRGRFEYLHDRERFDVGHHIGIARSLTSAGISDGDEDLAALRVSLEAAECCFADPTASTRLLKAHAAELAARIARLVDKAPGFGKETQHKIEVAVVSAMPGRVVFERVWYRPLGLDPDPGGLPALDEICKDTAVMGLDQSQGCAG